MTTLTKMDVAALRKADTLVVHLSKEHANGLVRAIKRVERDERNPFAQDVEHIITAASVSLYHSNASDLIANGGVRCTGHVSFYHSQNTPASTIIHTLREGDEITFRFYPDAHTNGYVFDAGLHADVLYLDVRRNGKRLSWKLDISICQNNTARMCYGVPYPAGMKGRNAA